jgi:AcrR family transcriptional regulator
MSARTRRRTRVVPRLRPAREPIELDQRWRLVDAVIELSGRFGSREVSIASLCAQAAVSPTTFYELFTDKDDLLVAAYRAAAEQFLGPIRSAIEDVKASELPRRALATLLEAVVSHPDAAWFLFMLPVGRAERLLSARGRAERTAHEMLQRALDGAAALDLPVTAVAGAVRHLVACHLLAYREDELASRGGEILAWVCSYTRALGVQPWSTSPAALLSVAATPQPSATAPETLPPGSHGLSASVVARSQRTRLINATAEVTAARGYQHATAGAIVATARVAKPVFYQHFSGKQAATLEAQEVATQYVLARCQRAYFSADEWPQRIWRLLATLVALVSANPAMSNLCLVESYRAGVAAIRRAEEVARSFTIFLEEGFHYGTDGGSLPRLVPQAVVGAISEILQRCAIARDWAEIPRCLPQLTYIALAPFVGAEHAIALVEHLKTQDRVLFRQWSAR